MKNIKKYIELGAKASCTKSTIEDKMGLGQRDITGVTKYCSIVESWLRWMLIMI